MNRADVKARLKLLPKIMGTTIDDLCRRLSISRKRWKEIKHSELDITTAHEIAEHSGLTLDWICYGRMDSLPRSLRERITSILDETKGHCMVPIFIVIELERIIEPTL